MRLHFRNDDLVRRRHQRPEQSCLPFQHQRPMPAAMRSSIEPVPHADSNSLMAAEMLTLLRWAVPNRCSPLARTNHPLAQATRG